MNESTIREAHLRLSEVDWCFREFARENPAWLDRANFGLLHQPNPLLKYRRQSWPTFVSRPNISIIENISLRISKLIRSLPRRVFHNDAVKIDEFYSLRHPALTEILLADPDGIAGAVGRGDFILTESGFKCIEFNIVANLGGWETAILAEMQLANPLVARYCADHGIVVRFANTLGVLFTHILEQIERRTPMPERVNVALVTEETELLRKKGAAGPYFDEQLQLVCGRHPSAPAGRVLVCDYSDLIEDSGRLYRAHEPVHAVVELYGGETSTGVYRAFKSGTVDLYNGPITRILSDKRNIALLSQLGQSPETDEEERRFIAAVVPWTRIVERRPVEFHGRTLPLIQLLESERERLVLKNTLLAGGAEVYVGAFTPPGKWSEVVGTALAGKHWVVQEYAQSLPLLFQAGDAGAVPHNVIWGPFVFGEHYGGSILRMQPQADRTVVNLTLTATEGVILEVEDADTGEEGPVQRVPGVAREVSISSG
jgi:hypothetical protein